VLLARVVVLAGHARQQMERPMYDARPRLLQQHGGGSRPRREGEECMRKVHVPRRAEWLVAMGTWMQPAGARLPALLLRRCGLAGFEDGLWARFHRLHKGVLGIWRSLFVHAAMP
jgi:hypothetical protein